MGLRGPENLPSPIAAKKLQVPSNQRGSERGAGREGTAGASCPAERWLRTLRALGPARALGLLWEVCPAVSHWGGEALARPL